MLRMNNANFDINQISRLNITQTTPTKFGDVERSSCGTPILGLVSLIQSPFHSTFSFPCSDCVFVKVLEEIAINKIRVAVSKRERLLYFKSVKMRGLGS